MRYALYTRKSTSDKDERQVQSIEDQQNHARRLAVERGYEITVEFSEARSAKEPYKIVGGSKLPARSEFSRMIDMIETGEIDGIIAWHPDRLSRNEIDAATLTHLLRTGKLKDLQFCQYSFVNSPEGIMMLQMALSQSQYYSSKLGKDVIRGMHAKMDKGWFPHYAPPGYVNDKHLLKGQKTISSDPVRFQTLRRAWDLVLTGTTSVTEAKKILNEQWGYRSASGRPMAKTTLHEMFSNVFYAGYFMQKGTLYRGKHQPMVTLEEYRQVQGILHQRLVRKPRKQDFAYTGLIRCANCGGQLTAYAIRKPSGLVFTYYRCQNLRGNCTQRNISEPELEKQVEQWLSRITVLPVFQEWAWEAYGEWLKAAGMARTESASRSGRSVKDIDGYLENLLDLRMKQLITDEEYLGKKQKLMVEREALAQVRDDVASSVQRARECMENEISFLNNALTWFRTGDVRTKRAIVTAVGSNFVLDQKKLLWEPHPLLCPVEKDYPALEAEYSGIGLAKISSGSTQKGSFEPVRSAWSRLWNQNLTLVAQKQLCFPKLDFCAPTLRDESLLDA